MRLKITPQLKYGCDDYKINNTAATVWKNHHETPLVLLLLANEEANQFKDMVQEEIIKVAYYLKGNMMYVLLRKCVKIEK
jgi:hypothetical protein